jgi:hypothetical protein
MTHEYRAPKNSSQALVRPQHHDRGLKDDARLSPLIKAVTSTIQATDKLRQRSLCWPKRRATAVQVANDRSWPHSEFRLTSDVTALSKRSA